MCTAINFPAGNSYFGRTLDVENGYDETITVTPRNFPIKFRNLKTLYSHYAIIGTSYIVDGFPLYYDATNEYGLSIAGLKFEKYSRFSKEKIGFENIASFEVILKLLGTCKDIDEVKSILKNINITNEGFSEKLPPSPLHWIVAWKNESLVIESTEKGIIIYENPHGVLTNSPTFDKHLKNYENFKKSKNDNPPCGISSEERFLKAVFLKENTCCTDNESDCVTQFFHILENVSLISGSTKTKTDNKKISLYSSCCNTSKGLYYYHTYTNNQISVIDMHKENLDSKNLKSYPMIKIQQIHHQN